MKRGRWGGDGCTVVFYESVICLHKSQGVGEAYDM